MAYETWQPETVSPDSLVLLLPGRGDNIRSFEEEGFKEDATLFLSTHPNWQIAALDAHLGYYAKRMLTERVFEDVILTNPAPNLILVGVSMGGLGSLLFADKHPEGIRQLILIAPFLGEDEELDKTETKSWESPPEYGGREYAVYSAWQYLKSKSWVGKTKIKIYMGREDRFRRGAELVQKLVPEVEVVWIDGGHRWDVWRAAWRQILSSWR